MQMYLMSLTLANFRNLLRNNYVDEIIRGHCTHVKDFVQADIRGSRFQCVLVKVFNSNTSMVGLSLIKQARLFFLFSYV